MIDIFLYLYFIITGISWINVFIYFIATGFSCCVGTLTYWMLENEYNDDYYHKILSPIMMGLMTITALVVIFGNFFGAYLIAEGIEVIK